MEPVFDRDLVTANRRRATAGGASDADFLLRHVAEDIAERLSAVERRFERAAVLDDAAGVLSAAIAKTDNVESVETGPLESDLEGSERVGLAENAFDFVASAMSLHLVNDTPGVLVQIQRALKPDGLFLAAIPGAGTLAELRDCLIAAEAEVMGGASPRVIPFGEVRDYGSLLQRAGFALPVSDVETRTVRYDTIFDLMLDLRAMGMANPLHGRSRKPVPRAFFQRAGELYAERYADPDGRIRATFSFVHLSGWKPHESQQKPAKPGSATTRLAEALNTRELPLKR
ncbi:methyltransferase domain-containing protein [Pararhizobium mangrovi]|uniref:Methyltransferase domain-containing protein n=1 Tax=Pararhizobium mangrovi TaxID=2590452 RepID=A0A506U2R7_9HYPH|nr:methyltransferase domain-containing protein [Pararhizobium mangrovi]TPW28653.1 methyltransferase domain-containing protein [Pararhizobium mangrovi]